MKLIIKFYNEWGNFTTIQLNLSSKGRIEDLKAAIARQTHIPVEQQEINVVNGELQFQMFETDKFLADYQLTNKSVIYVVNRQDAFSFEIPNGGVSIEMSEGKQSNNNTKGEVPNFSQDSISVRSTVRDSFGGENPFNSRYNETEFINILQAIIEAIKKEDLESTKIFYRLHKEKLLGLIDETKDPSEQALIKQQFDILNNVWINNWSVVNLATFIGNDKILLWVLSEGGDFAQETKDGWDCILLAIWQGRYSIMTLLLGQQTLDINKASKKGPPLHLAAFLDDPEAVRILLTHPKINLFLLNHQNKRPLDLAGELTRPLLLAEEKIILPKNTFDLALLDSFRTSVSNQQITYSSEFIYLSFMVNLPARPPIIQGEVLKVNYFKIKHYRRYIILDPDSGILARYKKFEDVPLNPNDLIPLETINDVRLSRDLWFQDDVYFYIEVSYLNKRIYLAMKHKAAARQWYDALRNSVGYVKYVHSKISTYMATDVKKAQLNVVQVMLLQANQNIVIDDDSAQIDIKSHIREQQILKKEKYSLQNNLNSVLEQSQDEESQSLQLKELYRSNATIESRYSKNLLVSDFEIMQHIGKGSFGNVYKAKCKINGKIYALKQQEKDKMISSNHLRYVIGELNILKKLHHPFLVHLNFAFQTPYYLYLALDYCGRGDLSRYMTRGVILDELTAKFIIAEIILAIEYLHEKNIIYRDLKPENVILDDEGYIKIIDFGLSKEGKDEDFIAKSFCGSPAYLSPELVTGSGTTKATDIYSVGTILYEMLTGYPPFFTTNLKDLLKKIRYQKLTVPSTLSKEANNLIFKMLEKNPEARIGAKNISVLKKHIFFAEINWDKLLQKKYIPPKLKERCLPPRTNTNQQQNNFQFDFDKDYETEMQRIGEIQNWNYGY